MRPHKEKRAKPDSIKTGFALTVDAHADLPQASSGDAGARA
jgi:hypothetical protein